MSEGSSRGYVLLWRQVWDNPPCNKPHEFTESEAWIYIFSNLANGIDRNGMPRGTFEASRGFLARKWMWSESRVLRFLRRLEHEKMIQKLSTDIATDIEPIPNNIANTKANRQANRFIVCKYETYQNVRTGNRTPKRTPNRTQSNERIKESITNESKNPLNPPQGDEPMVKKQSSAIRDLAYDAFARQHQSQIGCPYGSTKADFVRLAALRRQLGLSSREAPADWEASICNYFETPQGKYSLADLASRYAVFRKTSLDRYGKPIAQVAELDWGES